MFKKGFVSKYSLPNKNYENVLKSHLLSNSTIVIPANTILTTEIKDILINHYDEIKNGEIAIAHGKDVDSLEEYINKYPNYNQNYDVKELFKKFSENNKKNNLKTILVYDPADTQANFNKLMKYCAIDKKGRFAELFSNNDFNNAIINFDNFNLNEYFQIIDTFIKDKEHNKKLKTHGMYFYNYFGSTSIGAGNTFSLENSVNFNFIDQGYQKDTKPMSGISILITNILDFVDGRKEYTELSILESEKFLSKLSFKDILEIRSTWLYAEVIKKYDSVVEECANAYTSALNENFNEAEKHIKNAIDVREEIFNAVRAKLKHEVRAYKITKLLRVVSNLALKRGITDSLELIDPALDIVDTVYDSTKFTKGIIKDSLTSITEVSALTGNENSLKKLIKSKVKKYEDTLDMIEIKIGINSVIYKYLSNIAQKVRENHMAQL